MSLAGQAGRAIRRLSILLFLFGGWLWIQAANYRPFDVDFIVGGILVATGVGLWRRRPLARHLMIGAWYLVFAGAFVVPILLFVQRAFAGYAKAPWLYALVVAVAAAAGVVAYKALSYLRSTAAQEEYAGDTRRVELSAENSHRVLVAAGCWVGLFASAYLLGLTVPGGAPASRPIEAPPPGLQARVEPVEMPAPPPPAPARVEAGPRPDLTPLGFCFAAGRIRIVFTNRGDVPYPMSFRIAYGATREALQEREHEILAVPATDTAQTAEVFDVNSYYWEPGRKNFVVKLDGYEQVHESDETNNIASIELEKNAQGGVDLPGCDVVSARAADPGFVPLEVASQPKFDPRADLEPLGLCAKEQFDGSTWFNVVYGNAGNVRAPGRVRIEVQDSRGRWYLAEGDVPMPGFIQRASVSLRPSTADRPLTVFVDSGHVVSEVDETNNAKRFQTWHRNCDELSARIRDWKGLNL